ncbi:unnamed protein product, partial [Owenia fusiformis]
PFSFNASSFVLKLSPVYRSFGLNPIVLVLVFCLLIIMFFVISVDVYSMATQDIAGQPKTIETWQCQICMKTFKTRRVLRNHSFIHTGELPYQCDLCQDAFSHQMKLWRHKKKQHPVDPQIWTE